MAYEEAPVVPTGTGDRQPATRDWQAIAVTAVGFVGLMVGWSFQYMIVVWAVVLWRLFAWMAKAAVKLGVLGLLLLIVPVIGWIILIILLVVRNGQHEIAQAIAAQPPDTGKPARPIWRPWGIDWLRSRLRQS